MTTATPPSLRDYQTATIDRLEDAWARQVRRVVLVAPCGAGKTVILAEIIRRFIAATGQRVLFLAHRQELLFQTAEKLEAVGLNEGRDGYGILMGSHPAVPDAMVQVASIQTLLNRPKPAVGLVILDECHRSRSKGTMALLAFYPDARIVGASATPWRFDGKGLRKNFEESIVAATTADLIAQGHLADYEGLYFKPIDTKGVHKQGGDYKLDELGAVAVSEKGKVVIREIVAEYVRRQNGKRGVCFAVNIEHSKLIAKAFVEAGVKAEHADGTMPTEQRRAVIQRLRSGETTVLVNCNLVTEGFDLPALEVCMIARPTASVVFHLQSIGRALRPSPGKAKAVFHDHTDNFRRLGCPDDDRDYSLDGDGQVKGRRRRPIECWACEQTFIPHVDHDGACPHCGKRPEDKPRAPPNPNPRQTELDEEERQTDAVPLAQMRKRGPGAEKVETSFVRYYILNALRTGTDPKRVFGHFKKKFKADLAGSMFAREYAWANTQISPEQVEAAKERARNAVKEFVIEPHHVLTVRRLVTGRATETMHSAVRAFARAWGVPESLIWAVATGDAYNDDMTLEDWRRALRVREQVHGADSATARQLRQMIEREEIRGRMGQEFHQAAASSVFAAAAARARHAPEPPPQEPAVHRVVPMTAPSPEHGVLGVSPAASEFEIRAAYRRLAHAHHPDKGGSTERMAEINAAYEKLLGDARAKTWDATMPAERT